MGAPWVSFVPCGFIESDEPGLTGYQKAPNIRQWIVNPDAVAAILVPRSEPGAKTCVAMLMKSGHRIVVVGTADTVLAKLQADKPDCNQLGTKGKAGP